MCRGVLAGIKRFGNLACRSFCFGEECVDERRLSHPRLPDKNAGVSPQQRAKCLPTLKCRKLNDGIAKALVYFQRPAGGVQPVFQITFVEYDQGVNVLAIRSD